MAVKRLRRQTTRSDLNESSGLSSPVPGRSHGCAPAVDPLRALSYDPAISPALPRTVALLGGGVIGSGWAARLLLHGVDVRLYDPDPDAGRNVAETLEKARLAWRKLIMMPLRHEGRLVVAGSPEEAVAGAEYVQESAPEREDLKRELLARASRATAPELVVASSTSGLLPSRLQLDMAHPERLVVGHPFDPVYLLPLVEVCGGRLTDEAAIERAESFYHALGMSPLRLRREIQGLIAERLHEALRREALGLIDDDVATVSQVGDALRLGPGLRWSFTGVPEVQANRPNHELQQVRDDCLVAVIQGLRSHGVGAGAVLAAHERDLFGAAHARLMTDADDLSGPLRLHSVRVPAEWVDYNGHVSEARYHQVVSDATDAFVRYLGVTPPTCRAAAATSPPSPTSRS